MELCFATNNEHKISEILSMMGKGVVIKPMSSYGLTDDIPEPGETLEENSSIKARTVYEKLNIPVIADDSGLEVRALNNEPGVRSARYAGDQKDHEQNNQLLLNRLQDKTDRSARFRTVITLIDQGGERQFEGVVEGVITDAPRGAGGFGYDPLFVPRGFSHTFAEMTAQQKNQLSHRAKAFAKLADFLNG